MDYLITRSGIIFKFMYVNYERKIQWLDAPQFENLSKSKESISKKLRNFELTSGVSKKTGRPYYYMKFDVIKEPSEFVRKYLNPEYQLKQVPQLTYYKIIRTNEDIKSSLEYLLWRSWRQLLHTIYRFRAKKRPHKAASIYKCI